MHLNVDYYGNSEENKRSFELVEKVMGDTSPSPQDLETARVFIRQVADFVAQLNKACNF